jgi:hypothetical protein
VCCCCITPLYKKGIAGSHPDCNTELPAHSPLHLATAYSNKVAGFIERSQGLTSMSKRDFFPLFYRPWEASFKETTILKAFEATGLSSFNPEVTVVNKQVDLRLA